MSQIQLTIKKYRIDAYSRRAKKTKRIHAIIQDFIAVVPSTFGEELVTVLKIFVKARNKVANKHILPGTTSGGMVKLAHDTHTKSPLGR